MTVPSWMVREAIRQGNGLRCRTNNQIAECWQLLGFLLQMEWDLDGSAECRDCICLEEITLDQG